MIVSTFSSLLKSQLLPFLRTNTRTCTYVSVPPPKDPIVTILDAHCKIGKNLALLLKQNPLVGELRLYDKNSEICSVAEDLSHIDTKTKIKSFGGTLVMKHAVTDADIVVSVGGCKMSHKDTVQQLFEKNVDDIKTSTLHLIEFNPKAIYCIAKPPVEALVPLVSEEYKKAGVYDSRKIIGVTNVACMRANYHIACETGLNPSDVLCPVIGGLSTDCIIAILSQVRPKGHNPQRVASLQKTIQNSEDDVLKLYADCGTVCLTPALGISRFLNTLLKALQGETNCVDCAFVRQTGHIEQFLPYMTSIVRLGRHGVISSHMPKINGEEAHLLKKSALLIKNHIKLGESFATGESETDKEKQIDTSQSEQVVPSLQKQQASKSQRQTV